MKREITFKFEKLKIWQRAMDFAEDINALVKEFPDFEKFNLSSQIMRAVDSIALNISEGSIGQTDPEYKKFIGYSIRSLAEVVTCLHKAKRRDYLNNEKFEKLYLEAFEQMNMLTAFRSRIK